MAYTMPWWTPPNNRGTRTYARFNSKFMRWRCEDRAKELGHTMGPWIGEEGDGRKGGARRIMSWVSKCDKCELWMGVTWPDPEDEPTGTYGSVLVLECKKGLRPWWTGPEYTVKEVAFRD